MNIALIGYGKMGKEIEKIAIKRGHKIVAKIDMQEGETFESKGFKQADVAIEFTVPKAAFDNIKTCFKNNIPVVSGTTGWLDKMDEIKNECLNNNKTLFYASNYSIGVNIFFEINKQLARLMNKTTDYDVSMKEIHHIHKKDSPSGTAITLAEGIIDNYDTKNNWSESDNIEKDIIHIESLREGEVPGTHIIKYNSTVDEIQISHKAKSRKGFALGAVLAAEFTANNHGFLGMKDLLNL